MKSEHINVRIGPYMASIGGVSKAGINKTTNQDDFCIGAEEKQELAYIIVADGLGSCKYSDLGAKRMVSIVQDWFVNQLPQYSFLSENVSNIMVKRLTEKWNESYGLEEIYDYDTTIHYAVVYKGRLLIGGIGDGMALVSGDNIQPKDCVENKSLFSNVTDSMCSINADENISNEIFSQDGIDRNAVVILSSDGIADDLIPEKKTSLLSYFMETNNGKGPEILHKELYEWVDDWETESHSDDKTLCYLIIRKED